MIAAYANENSGWMEIKAETSDTGPADIATVDRNRAIKFKISLMLMYPQA